MQHQRRLFGLLFNAVYMKQLFPFSFCFGKIPYSKGLLIHFANLFFLYLFYYFCIIFILFYFILFIYFILLFLRCEYPVLQVAELEH